MEEKRKENRLSVSGEDNAVNAAYAIAASIQIAQDYWQEFISTDIVRNTPHKADRLMCSEAFNRIYNKVRKSFGGNGFGDFNDKVCDIADEMMPMADGIKNCFYTQTVTKFRLDDCNALSLFLTTTVLARCSAELTRLAYGTTSPLLVEVMKHMDNFGNRVSISALNEGITDIDYGKAEPLLAAYLERLYAKTRNGTI